MTLALRRYLTDPENAESNFALGLWYEDQGHTAPAAGLYVRTAEFSSDDLLSYEALLRAANCFTRQGDRIALTTGVLLRALALQPARPEAYFLLSRLYEVNKQWQEAYAFAVLGQRAREDHPPLQTNVDYPGRYALVFEQAVAAWWIGLFDESIHLFRELQKNPTMLPVHITAVQNNLTNLGGVVWREPLAYNGTQYERLRVKFPGARTIEANYSQVYQDLFVLTMLAGKRDGRFVEIGCGDPVFGNNTKLLEEWGWQGVSIDHDPTTAEKFAGRRTSRVIVGDAVQVEYEALLTGDYEYLQIDVDPALTSLMVLLGLPFDQHRFAVITFEHDDYCTPGIKERSRQYLRSHGYVLIVGDIAPDCYNNFEDWWVHPDLVKAEIIETMRDDTSGVKRADWYMLGRREQPSASALEAR